MASYELVPATRARELIGDVAQPLVVGFERIRGLMWAKQLSPGIRAVIEVRAVKGGQFDITYGVCCDWVPHRRGDSYRWHRTLKQTRLDLWVDHSMLGAEPRQWISTLGGEELLRRQAGNAVRQVAMRAEAWWEATANEAGVLSEAYRQAANKFDIHDPRARFVVGFTHARFGDLRAAKRELALVRDWAPEPHRLAELDARLSEVVDAHPGDSAATKERP
jgi:hypothetical protein